MRQTITKQIKADTYTISQVNTDVAAPLCLMLAKAFSAMGAAAVSDPATALPALLREISPDDLRALASAMVDVTLVNGKPLKSVYGEHFAGAMGAWASWLFAATMHNFADFFGELQNIATEHPTG